MVGSTDRLESMRRFVEARPDEAFPRYGLAMECEKQGRLEEADAEFTELRRRHPDYLPAYHQHGMLLMRLGRKAEARSTIEQGIRLSTAQGNDHAREQLAAMLAEISG